MSFKRVFGPAIVIAGIVVFALAALVSGVRADCNCNDQAVLAGDINGSGAVDPIDVAYLVNYVLKGLPAGTPVNDCDAEINGYCNPVFRCAPSLGDVLTLIDYVYRSVDQLVPCTQGINVADGDLEYIYPGVVNIPSGNGTVQATIGLLNMDQAAVDLRGYGVPIIAFWPSNISITQVDIDSRFNPGTWEEETFTRGMLDGIKTMVFAYAADPVNTVPIGTGQYPTPWVELTIHYSNPGNPSCVLVLEYDDPPGDYAAYYTPGMNMARAPMQATILEYTVPVSYVTDPLTPVEVPATTETGVLILITIVAVSGILAVIYNRRRCRMVG